MSNVLKHFDRLWCPDMIKQSSFLYVVGPFDDLPHKLAQDIFTELKNRKQLRRHHIQMLINAFWRCVN